MSHPDGIVPAGALVLLCGGRDEDAYVAGVYRVAEDLDLDDLTVRYVATVPRDGDGFSPPELPPVAFGIDPRSANPMQRGFIAWLVDQHLVERQPTYEVYLDGSMGRNQPVLSARIEQVPTDVEEFEAPAP